MTDWPYDLTSGTTRVAHLRIRDPGLDPLTTRSRAVSVLNSTPWHVPELPPTAILCIRRFSDPLPGTLRFDRGHGTAPLVWQQAATAALKDFVRMAARPATGAVPATANAVVFLDRSELLACLARDWCDGSKGLHWWWHGLLPDANFADALLRCWLGAVEYVPAALQLLTGLGGAPRFVRVLDERAVRALLDGIARCFGLETLVRLLEDTPFTPKTGRAEELQATSADERVKVLPTADGQTEGSAAVDRQEPTRTPPWRPWITAGEEDGLASERLGLLVVGLLLARAPVVVRQQSFVTAAAAWWGEGPVSVNEHAREAHESPRVQNLEQSPAKAAGRHAQSDVSQAAQRLRVSPQHAGLPAESPESRTTNLPAQHQATSAPDVARMQSHRPPGEEERKAVAPSSISPVAPVATTTIRALLDEVPTDFGGVFYLVNVGLFLGLYGDFTEPLRPTLALPVWDFLALAGRDITGAQLEIDPVWELFARLSGREPNCTPGRGFAAPAEWPRPQDWGEFSAVTSSLAAEPHGSAAEWIAWLMTYVRWRLARALGLESPAELSRVLCERPARARVTDTHLDVTFALAQLPISVRIAGLDRDPGWVPAAGRFIAFHYD